MCVCARGCVSDWEGLDSVSRGSLETVSGASAEKDDGEAG